MPRPPVQPVRVSPHGGYAFPRLAPAQGACGIGKHPCVHWGVDLVAPVGMLVVAPEAGTIVYAAPGTVPPLRGYDPAAVILRGVSGVYHLLAHLASPLPIGEYVDAAVQPTRLEPGRAARARLLNGPAVLEGQTLGTISSAAHVHWEVRRTLLATDRPRETLDPLRWLELGPRGGVASRAGGGGVALLFFAVVALGGFRVRSRR